MITDLPPPSSRSATAFLYDIARDRFRASSIAACSSGYTQRRQPPAAGPRAVEWTAIKHFQSAFLVVKGVKGFVTRESGGIENAHDVSEGMTVGGKGHALYASPGQGTTPGPHAPAQTAVIPASTVNSAPVTYRDSSEAR